MTYYISVGTVIVCPFLSLILLIKIVFLFWLLQLRACPSCLPLPLVILIASLFYSFPPTHSHHGLHHFFTSTNLGLGWYLVFYEFKVITRLHKIFSIVFNVGTQSYKFQNRHCCITKCPAVFLFSFDSRNFFKFLPYFFNESLTEPKYVIQSPGVCIMSVDYIFITSFTLLLSYNKI